MQASQGCAVSRWGAEVQERVALLQGNVNDLVCRLEGPEEIHQGLLLMHKSAL